ncbi:hypothetical protein MHU86_16940 [Fragilaria crotonensis]|nr:hypothetical protein MHU86_16940 [Fragilaria crotonensis]
MVAQTSIAKGNSIEKLRLTHDQSFSPSGVAGRSVNERVDTSQLTEARFGKAFSRLMYHISFLRQLWPDEPIWMTKVDCKSAYRRIHLKAATAMKSCTYRRPAVSGAEDDVRWSAKPIAMERRVGDDHGLGKRPCPQGRLGSERLPLAAPAPPGHRRAVDNDKGSVDKMSVFGKADYFAVNYPPYDDLPRFDCYLDDILGPSTPRRRKERCRDPLALHLVGRPCDPEVKETFPRDDILAIPKFLAEAKPSEDDPRMDRGHTRFVVALPHDKHMSWTQAVDRMLTHRHAFVTTRDLETTLGRFSHAAYVIPYARHFMGRLYKACERSKQAGKARLTKPQLDDLILWKAFLQKASRGISINRLVCRWPTRIVRVDACPQGIGGYCLKSAWRGDISYQSTCWGGDPKHSRVPCCLCGDDRGIPRRGRVDGRRRSAQSGDSTSAAGWLAKSNFNDDCPLHLTIARAFADFCLTHEIDHYTQWFGKENKVADMLSRFRSRRGTDRLDHEKLLTLALLRKIPRTNRRSRREPFLKDSDEKRKQKRSPAAAAGTDGRSRQPQEAGNGPLSGSIRATLDGVAQAFRLNKFESPIHDAAGRLDPLLAQLKRYADEDPGPTRRRCR